MSDIEQIQNHPLVGRYRKACVKRGPGGIKTLGRRFKNYDNDLSGFLSKSEFIEGVMDSQVDMNMSELNELYDIFDRDDNGSINYEEFLACVRPPMSSARKKMIETVFRYFDKDGSGEVTLEDISKDYDVGFHPKYKSGEMTKKQILTEFLNTFEPDPEHRDGRITAQEFLNYYAGVSCSIDKDVYFDYMMRQAWPKAFKK